MISPFKFVSYKIDSAEFFVQKNLGLLQMNAHIDPSLWKISLDVRVPQFFAREKIYVGGVDIVMMLFPSDVSEEKKTEGNVLVRLKMGIAGCFSSEGRFEKDLEENLVRSQIPAILLPYLRGAATSLFANAGFGTIVLPLINIQEYAQKYLQNQEIQVIETQSPAVK